ADNVGLQDLPGINTEVDKETEITHQYHHGVAVAGFIPDKEKVQSDIAVMKKAYSKGLHWLFNPKPLQPLAQTATDLSTDEPLAQARILPIDEGVANRAVRFPDIAQNMPPLLTAATRSSDALFCAPLSDGHLPIYQFGYGELSSTSVPYNTIAVDHSLFEFNLDKDKIIPIYQASLSKRFPFYDYHPVTGRLNITIDVPIDVSKPREPFRLPSAVPAYDKNPVWNHVFAFCRGVEKARDMTVDALLHPIDTIVDTGTLVWDGYSALADISLGISTDSARERNRARGNVYYDMMEEFESGDSIYRTEVLSQISTSLLFGRAMGGAPVKGILTSSKQVSDRLLSYALRPVGLSIKTDHGYANQCLLPGMFWQRRKIMNGAPLYRVGTKGRSKEPHEAQFWATTYEKEKHAMSYGLPENNAK
ncbi:MAG TPA: hypothetical protein PLD88_13970, partial [Candidatus Berkiella sp.]|nr:hypothetical protein [Candidatus Berkiella sp.]